MNTGRTLQELAVEIDRQSKSKRDFVASASAMKMINGYGALDSLTANRFEPHRRDTADIGSFGMTDLFHRQLGDAVGIPAKYYDHMRAADPELLSHNVNHWLQREES
ncbi:MAG: hypothetical protein LBS11_07220 [Oscillospiraceae bacterium]|jgi:hypothetical protein|nr:hypothetical protein [Oscillospiraceae bacterium]